MDWAMHDLSSPEFRKAERFYTLDGAYYRHRAGGDYMGIDDVLSPGTMQWKPYEGEDSVRPVMFGSQIDASRVPTAAQIEVEDAGPDRQGGT